MNISSKRKTKATRKLPGGFTALINDTGLDPAWQRDFPAVVAAVGTEKPQTPQV